jgi:hypothetical protein
MLFEVYVQKKRAPEAGVPAMPMEETLQNLRAVASQNQTFTQKDKAFAPTLSALQNISNQVADTYHGHKKELGHRVKIV